jgi:thiol-disulfide isomerase/thioredoxin
VKKTLVLILSLLSLSASAGAQGMKGDDSAASSPGGAMMAADPSRAVFDLKGMAPGVLPFSSEAAAQALAAKRRVVYFFAASWCPTCQETYRNLKADAKKTPSDLTILVVDFDASKALKAKYGVMAQHTFVLIGPKGEKQKAWLGTTTVEEISRNAVKA